MVTQVTQESFPAEVLRSKGITVVDFWATWCGPCKRYGPIFEEFAGANGDKAKFVKIDVDSAQDIASELGVQSIPTTVFFKDGEPVDRTVGILSKDMLAAKIKELA